MDPQCFSHPGWIGGLIGLLGGAFGVHRSWRAAKSRKERRALLLFTLATLLLIALQLLVVMSVKNELAIGIAWLAYTLLLGILILFYNRTKRLPQP